MNPKLLAWHKFLLRHYFYPLLLSSLMACSFLLFRVLYSHTYNYSNLLWNLFLAWLPYTFSVIAASFYQTSSKRWGFILLFIIFWLVFFPNAPYIVTDFYYLDPRPPIPLWFDISLIAIFAFTGCFLAIASLRIIHLMIDKSLGKIVGWLFALFSLGLASLGVYLGRFGRYNSWDILLAPKSLIKELVTNLFNPLDNLGFLGFTVMFTSILLVFYLMFVTASTPYDTVSN
jgi:uncharacterized membrane protein